MHSAILSSQCIPRRYIHEDCALFSKLATSQEGTYIRSTYS